MVSGSGKKAGHLFNPLAASAFPLATEWLRLRESSRLGTASCLHFPLDTGALGLRCSQLTRARELELLAQATFRAHEAKHDAKELQRSIVDTDAY